MIYVWLTASVVFFLYGLSIKAVRSGTLFYRVWLCMGAACLFLSVCAALHVWDRLIFPVRLLILLGTVLGLVLFLFVLALILSGFIDRSEKNLGFILILGAQIYKRGPSRALKFRLERAYRYLKENPDTLCIVSGGQGFNEPFTEAFGMARYLKEKGIDGKRILLEDRSTSTLENILFCKCMLPADMTVGIVTNDFHIFRSVRIAKKQGLKAVGIPASSTWFYRPNNVLREVLGIIKDTLKRNM